MTTIALKKTLSYLSQVPESIVVCARAPPAEATNAETWALDWMHLARAKQTSHALEILIRQMDAPYRQSVKISSP